MHSTPQTRHRRFLEFAREFHADLGTGVPDLQGNAETPVAFEATVDDVRILIGYDPNAGESCLFLWTVLGSLPPVDEAATLRRLLELNVRLVQEQGTAYCIDSDSGDVVCYTRIDIERSGVAAVREQLGRLADTARQWHRDRFPREPADATDETEARRPPAGIAFA